LEEKTARFLRSLYARYYARHGPNAPEDIAHREFAFMTFGEKMVIRHKGFVSYDELKSFMAKLGPSDAFYSSAYFERPDEPDMKAKGWLGADLIFDIDADHIPTACKREHDLWVCKSCGRNGRGEAPERCPGCGSKELMELKWICEKCISAAREELLKLIEVLEEDLDLCKPGGWRASFSGHRGFHLQIYSEEVRDLGQDERGEIIDYLMGVGLEPELLGLVPGAKLGLDEPGWRGRLAKVLYSMLYRADEGLLKSLGLRKKAIEALLASRETILDCIEDGRPLYLPKGVGKATLDKLLKACALEAGVKIDPVVTRDTHRLVRMSGSLHGKTGFLKRDIGPEDLEDFNPFRDALAFKSGWAKVRVSDAFPRIPILKLGDEAYGPFEPGEIVELPLQAAVFLMCKGVAELA